MGNALEIEIVEHRIGAREAPALLDQPARLVPFAGAIGLEDPLMKGFEREEFRIGPRHRRADKGVERLAAAVLGRSMSTSRKAKSLSATVRVDSATRIDVP